MKKLYITGLALILSAITGVSRLMADEGMWIPLLLKQFNEGDMQKIGMKISAEDIFSVNKSSLKDAIVHFGGGCTGEIVSDQGLLLTNHHCGYGNIQYHSSVDHDYLKNGFWAKNKSEELPCPGLTVTFVIRIEDVTKGVLAGITDTTSETNRSKIINENIKKIEAEAVKGTRYDAKIKAYFYGNEFYMLVSETYKDVRLVGTPPEAIGKFGGDTDNWMWPRHTGDFSVFRVYANEKNEPAEYSASNKPYKPKRFLEISMKGVKPGDFTMTYGFPGRTFEYLTSYGIKQVVQVSNPANIKVRETKLGIWEADMKASTKVRIQYASKFAGISNYHKKWIGEDKGMKVLNTLEMKEDLESKFQSWADADPERKKKYGNLLNEFKTAYEQFYPLQKEADLYIESGMGIEIVGFSTSFLNLYMISKKEGVTQEEINKEIEKIRKNSTEFYKNYNAITDQKVLAALLKNYGEKTAPLYHAAIFGYIDKKYKGDYNKFAADLFKTSILVDQNRMNEFLNSYTAKKHKKLGKDMAFALMENLINNYNSQIRPSYNTLSNNINTLHRKWVAGLREMQTDRKFWPDANSTLRVAYGKVEPYKPFDGATYHYVTYLKGIMEKEDSLIEDYEVPTKLKELYKKKDYGEYADASGDVPVAFIATNHTTGGNSGSPLLNDQGQLLGLNFDTVWEGTCSNYHFDESRVRNISVDIRYVLFVMDKYAGAKYLVDEMKLMR